jgi:hypothetical protein
MQFLDAQMVHKASVCILHGDTRGFRKMQDAQWPAENLIEE